MNNLENQVLLKRKMKVNLIYIKSTIATTNLKYEVPNIPSKPNTDWDRLMTLQHNIVHN